MKIAWEAAPPSAKKLPIQPKKDFGSTGVPCFFCYTLNIWPDMQCELVTLVTIPAGWSQPLSPQGIDTGVLFVGMRQHLKNLSLLLNLKFLLCKDIQLQQVKLKVVGFLG